MIYYNLYDIIHENHVKVKLNFVNFNFSMIKGIALRTTPLFCSIVF